MTPAPDRGGATRASAPRRTGLRLGALVALAMLALGCPRQPPPLEVVVPPLHDDDPAAQAAFDAARAEYEAGRFRSAADLFRLFGAQHPTSPLAPRAELYLGRSLVADGDTAGGLPIFASLGTCPDRAIAQLAHVYLAFTHGVRGEFDAADDALRRLLLDDPRYRLPVELAITGDVALLASLVAEAHLEHGAASIALGELEWVAAWADDDALLYYAYDRAVEVAETRLTPVQLREAVEGSSEFVLAVAAAAAIAERLDAGDADGAAAVLARAAGPMAALGLNDRLDAAQRLLAADTGAGAPRIGLVASLSGPNRRAGRAVLGGALLAMRAFAPAEPRALLFVRDAQGDADATRAAVEELDSLGAVAVIAPLEPDLATIACETASAAGMGCLSLSTDPLSRPRTGVWRLQMDAAAEAAVIARTMHARGADRVVVVRSDDLDGAAYTERFAEAVTRAVTDVGGAVVAEVALDTAGATLQETSQEAARAVAAARPTGVVLALDAERAAAVAAWLAMENVWAVSDPAAAPAGRTNVVLAASSFAAADVVLRNASRYFVDALVPVYFHPQVATGEAASFAARFEMTYGRPATALDAFAYDATALARAMLLDRGAADRGAFRAAMDALAGWPGVVGPIAFDGVGNATVEPTLATVRGGAFAPIAP